VENDEMPIVHLICGGDKEAYWRLVQPRLRAVLWVSKAILGNSGGAEGISQEAILKGLRNIHGFRGEPKFSAWLIQITIDEARNTLRQNRSCRSQLLEGPETEDLEEYVPAHLTHWREIPSAALDHQQARDALQRAFWSLPRNHREVFAVKDIARLSTRETAQVLGLSERNVKARLLRARLQMRDALAGLKGRWCQRKAQYQTARA
jgi:RNA polymerase sigma-70 factor, ECF subfamily